jgi:glutamate-5-semialdehyde dehydrogenase
MAAAVRAIADQPAVLGEIVEGRLLGNGVRLEKRRVPLGVVLVIYESRPNVTSDAAALCIKSGNAVVLKGGREARSSNRAIAGSIAAGLRKALPDALQLADAVAFVDLVDRAAVGALVRMDDAIDLAIPRGGRGLIRAVVEAATVPVVKHDAGVCHVYVDAHQDEPSLAGAIDIVMNAKTQRPGVCNACETLLVHERVATNLLRELGPKLADAGVELRADERAITHLPSAVPATDADWSAEYLDLVLAVKVVDSFDDAVAHIERHGSQHTDAIVTSSHATAEAFAARVTSANVMINCSTRFSDGGVYGLGAEIGISTDKLHARGPMGARDLTTYQWVATGTGHVRH